MSTKLINLSPDLKRLRDEGYEITVKDGHLLVYHIPYVNNGKKIGYGILLSQLDMAGERTAKPGNHVIHFQGEYPCDKEGNQLPGIRNKSVKNTFAGVEIDHSFSNKPGPNGFADYYEKITSYIRILQSQAEAIDNSVTARTFKVIEDVENDSVFHYIDTNSSRAAIMGISEKLRNMKIAIIGLGGTGSYILDFLSKTEVREIHIFDGDVFRQHNAFRAPGAASKDTVNIQPKKVIYLHEIYSRMHKYVFPHDYNITAEKLNELSGMNFVFISIDNGEAKKIIVDELVRINIPFIDTGIAVEEVNGALNGSVRVTTVTGQKKDHVCGKIDFSDNGNNDYIQNIQIAELNALNATLAIIKWKKLCGFYHDQEKEYHSALGLNVNEIVNDDHIA